MKKQLYICLLAFSLSGCFTSLKPSYDLTVSYDESAPPEYKLGWQHGCESGLSAYGNNYYKSLYKFKQDLSMIKNEYYFKAWNDSFNFCRANINRSLAGDYKGQNDAPALFSPRNLDITYGRKGDIATTVKWGAFGGGGKEEKGLMSDMFDVQVPGFGSTAWGADPYGGKCDWLGRCGDDIPKDPMDALMGH